MSNKSFTEQTKDWVKFLYGVKQCHFIGSESIGKKGEKYGSYCFKPSMNSFMEEQGWRFQEYPCAFFNGTPGSCTNGSECHFGHKSSPRWVKVKSRRNFENSPSQDIIPDEVSIVSTVSNGTTMSQPLNLARPSPTSNGSCAWSAVVQGFSYDPEIKKWEVLLEKITKKKEAFLSDKYYNPEREGHKIRLKSLNDKIEKCEKEIQQLNEALLDEEDDDVDVW